jgi:hypothetical protein
VLGVVSALKTPRKSNGIDYVLSLVITDPILPEHIQGLTINIFRTNISLFPKVEVGPS